jgi:hypothetical protein
VLPRREDLSGDRGVLIVAYASHKKKAYSFFLLQVTTRRGWGSEAFTGGGKGHAWHLGSVHFCVRCSLACRISSRILTLVDCATAALSCWCSTPLATRSLMSTPPCLTLRVIHHSLNPPPPPCSTPIPSSRAQSEYGDIYKATLEHSAEGVSELKVKYFDTLPPCVSLAVLKTGFLFCASETGNHALYQFVVSLGGVGLRGVCWVEAGCGSV